MFSICEWRFIELVCSVYGIVETINSLTQNFFDKFVIVEWNTVIYNL